MNYTKPVKFSGTNRYGCGPEDEDDVYTVAVIKDVATLGGAILDKETTYTGDKLRNIGEDIEEAKDELWPPNQERGEMMDTWIKGKKVQLEEQDRAKDGDRVFISSRYEGTKSGYNQHDIKISRLKDGALSFWEDGAETHIYLYPEQVKHLRKILRSSK